MNLHQFRAEQFLPIDKIKAWEFFSSAKNLSLITPPEMDFKIISQLDGKEIFEGMLIDYKVKPLLGITFHWQTEICKVENQKYFTDRQSKGPYKVWEHKHTFTEINGGVLMKDEVNYTLPFGIIGRLLNSILIKRKIKSIFDYRKNVLNNMFR